MAQGSKVPTLVRFGRAMCLILILILILINMATTLCSSECWWSSVPSVYRPAGPSSIFFYLLRYTTATGSLRPIISVPPDHFDYLTIFISQYRTEIQSRLSQMRIFVMPAIFIEFLFSKFSVHSNVITSFLKVIPFQVIHTVVCLPAPTRTETSKCDRPAESVLVPQRQKGLAPFRLCWTWSLGESLWTFDMCLKKLNWNKCALTSFVFGPCKDYYCLKKWCILLKKLNSVQRIWQIFTWVFCALCEAHSNLNTISTSHPPD